jgi:hypothetical protein
LRPDVFGERTVVLFLYCRSEIGQVSGSCTWRSASRKRITHLGDMALEGPFAFILDVSILTVLVALKRYKNRQPRIRGHSPNSLHLCCAVVGISACGLWEVRALSSLAESAVTYTARETKLSCWYRTPKLHTSDLRLERYRAGVAVR